MFGTIKKMFTVLLSNTVNGSNHTKCMPLGNQKCMTQHTLIKLCPNEYSQEFHYYPFAVKLDRCVGSCNMTYLIKCVFQIKKKYLNLSVLNMITGTNESKTLTKHLSCKCKCRFDGKKCGSDQWWDNNKC